MPHATETNGAPPPPDVLTAEVQALSRQVKALSLWDDRLGSAVTRAWHWRLVALALLLINGFLVWAALRTRAEILPYVYLVDVQGHILWQGVPGSYQVQDVWVLTHVAEWIERTRSRSPDLVVVARNWTKAVAMTPLASEARAKLNSYMDLENPSKLPQPPRVEVKVLTKRVMHRGEQSGDYRLSWQELQYGPSGYVMKQTRWEGDFRVELKPPRRQVEANVGTFGIMIVSFAWSEAVAPQ